MPSCKLCNYPERAAIEQKIASRQLSMTKAAKIVDCNKASVSRHMSRCVAAKVAKTANSIESREALNVIDALTESHDRVLDIFNDALDDGDRRSALGALDTEVRQLILVAKVTGQLNEAPQLNILMNPEFMKLKSVIIKTLEPYPEARLKLSERLEEILDDGD
jgi:hypothetical protein